MEALRIIAPRLPRHVTEDTEPPGTTSLKYRASPFSSGPACCARMGAAIALENINVLLTAADARRRCGSWEPQAGASLDACECLADARDIVARHTRRH